MDWDGPIGPEGTEEIEDEIGLNTWVELDDGEWGENWSRPEYQNIADNRMNRITRRVGRLPARRNWYDEIDTEDVVDRRIRGHLRREWRAQEQWPRYAGQRRGWHSVTESDRERFLRNELESRWTRARMRNEQAIIDNEDAREEYLIGEQLEIDRGPDGPRRLRR